MLAMAAWTWALAPLPMLTIAITAATPMMMPRAVRIERMVLRLRARKAIRRVMKKRMKVGNYGCLSGRWSRRRAAWRRFPPP